MRWLGIACAVWLLTLASQACALTPMEYTRMTLERATAIMTGNATHNAKLAELSELFNKFLDTDAMAQAALGSHSFSFNPSQRREFCALFHVLIERTYVQKLTLFEKPKFEYVGEIAMNASARVDTRIVTLGDKFSVDYEFRHEGGGWKVTSITVENVNLTANYAAQLNRLLTRSSVEDVLALMRKKFGSRSEAAK